MSSPKSKVLVTGASGYIAAWIIRELLEHNYHVVGCVRSQTKADAMRQKLGSKYQDRLDFCIVKDIATAGAFDEAVKGVDGIIHTASPFTFALDDNESGLLKPAINGTLGILKSIKTHNPNLKRVVITSSFAAMMDVEKGPWPGHIYSEKDWNPATYEQAKTANGPFAYSASKKLAEEAAWKFMEEEQPTFELTAVCPGMIYGPTIHPVSSMDALNASSADIYRFIDGSQKEVPDAPFYAYVDVRDVAVAHRLAYENTSAAGQRFLVLEAGFSYQDVCDIIRKNFPEQLERTPRGRPGRGDGGVDHYGVDNQKSRDLGVKYMSLEKCIVDTTRDLLELERTLLK